MRRREWMTSAAVIAVVLISSRIAHGQITLTSAVRTISANARMACGPAVDQSSMSPASPFGVFNGTVSETMSGNESNSLGGLCVFGSELFTSTATQNTNVVAVGSLISGSGSAVAGMANGANEGGSAQGSSTMTVTFSVGSSSFYSLTGDVDGFVTLGGGGGFLPGFTSVSLMQGSTIIHSESPNPPDMFGQGTLKSFAYSGVLGPGNYTLTASAFAGAAGPGENSMTGSFHVTFVPEPSGLSGYLVLLGLAFRRRAQPRGRGLR